MAEAIPMKVEIMPTEPISISKPTIPYNFALANLAATQTGTAIPILGGAINEYLMPTSGYITGYAINLSAAFSAGSADVDLTVNGTSTLTIPIDTASVTEYRAFTPIPNEPFQAGDELGVTYTTDGSASPTTNDVVVTVFVVFSDFNV